MHYEPALAAQLSGPLNKVSLHTVAMDGITDKDMLCMLHIFQSAMKQVYAHTQDGTHQAGSDFAFVCSTKFVC